jgi:hypothetical protein
MNQLQYHLLQVPIQNSSEFGEPRTLIQLPLQVVQDDLYVFIDLQSQVKEKINNIQTVSFSTDGNENSIFPASIQGNDVKLYSFHARSNFMSVQVVSYQGTTLDSFSHSIGIHLASDVKDK